MDGGGNRWIPCWFGSLRDYVRPWNLVSYALVLGIESDSTYLSTQIEHIVHVLDALRFSVDFGFGDGKMEGWWWDFQMMLSSELGYLTGDILMPDLCNRPQLLGVTSNRASRDRARG